ncbi:hypothetical protein LINPERHAP1_LOCUS12079 [Linum perenne]
MENMNWKGFIYLRAEIEQKHERAKGFKFVRKQERAETD